MENRFFIFIQENPEKETKFGIKEDPDYFKKGVSVSIGAIGSKKIDNISQNYQNPYVKNIIKPAVNSIFSEMLPTGVDKTEEFMNKAMESITATKRFKMLM